MTSLINEGGGFGRARILVHDLTILATVTLDEVINFTGTSSSGEIRAVFISETGVDVGIKVDGAWHIHDNFIRTVDTAIVIDGDDCVITGNRARNPTGFTDHAIIINGDDNVITGNHLSSGIRIVGDDNIITGNLIANVGAADNGIIVDGDRNLIAGNKVFPDGATPPVGIEIVSGATDNIIGINDVAQATTPITDAGTGTIYKAVREALWIVAGTLATGTGVDPRRINEDIFIIDAAAVVDTAPTDASLIVDVHLNGTTIFTTQGNRPTIVTTAKDSGLAVPDVTAAVGGDVLTVDIDQIGSTVAGADLAVVVRYVNVGVTG